MTVNFIIPLRCYVSIITKLRALKTTIERISAENDGMLVSNESNETKYGLVPVHVALNI